MLNPGDPSRLFTKAPTMSAQIIARTETGFTVQITIP